MGKERKEKEPCTNFGTPAEGQVRSVHRPGHEKYGSFRIRFQHLADCHGALYVIPFAYTMAQSVLLHCSCTKC